ncbi:hypothetical protein [Streptomyces sp. URMC 123]|uniref:hypothetical protein n=1 Tax=Streptomyces sp. URMC 123 TaxID=3423403 RepID=UPI003F1A38E9
MTVVTRFVTHVDLDDENTYGQQVSMSARLEVSLADGRSLVLLSDRGWASAGGGENAQADLRATASVEDIETTARMVVGPDEPLEGRTYEETDASYWAFLARILQHEGVEVDPQELKQLRHDVVLSERLREWVS